MSFNSLQFIIFLPIVLVLYFALPVKLKNLWLLLASYYFYMCWSAKYALLILTSTVITYLSGLLLEQCKNPKAAVVDKSLGFRLKSRRYRLKIQVSNPFEGGRCATCS